ncbi:MAG: 16S rRNA (cytosine(1402)-N(4))-methyltransferase, partial [Planctomycetales bacterium 12-60-4]
AAPSMIATATEAELISIFSDYGEEPAARKLATAIVQRRSQQSIQTALQLAEIAERTLGSPSTRERHPATRIFQALRIAVNRELDHVRQALDTAFPQCLAAGGLLAVISFHSLEDRLVKEAFRRSDVWDVVTAKPVAPTPAEERVNPRSRSAKLRVARRTDS